MSFKNPAQITVISMSQTLFEKYGRTPAIATIVKSFYKQVLAQQELRGYFTSVPIERLIEHQIAFVSVAMGENPLAYTGRPIDDAHRSLRITEADFDLVAALFERSLQEAQLEPADLLTIVNKIKAIKALVVTR